MVLIGVHIIFLMFLYLSRLIFERIVQSVQPYWLRYTPTHLDPLFFVGILAFGTAIAEALLCEDIISKRQKRPATGLM